MSCSTVRSEPLCSGAYVPVLRERWANTRRLSEAEGYALASATGRNPRQRFWLVSATSALSRLAADCHRLQPRGSIKAPSLVVKQGDSGGGGEEQPRPGRVTGRSPMRCRQRTA